MRNARSTYVSPENTLVKASGFKDARRDRGLAEVFVGGEPEADDELDVLEVTEAMEATEAIDVIEVEDAVASIGALSIGRDSGA
ncbi:hypothetical protein BGZ54_000837 [Gamsiella multidivaricata]|nr:hypothetical protein BGZ54_000837 [Gamsiella multidivaricata]